MTEHRTRRDVLKVGLAAASLLPAASTARLAFAGSRPGPLSLEPLGERLHLVSGAACNVVVLRGDDGLLLVDGGSAAEVRPLLRLLDEHFPKLPVKALFNTHWHLANTGLNAEVRKRGGDILAHENTRLWMTTVVDSRWENRVYKPRPQGEQPNRTFFDGVQSLEFAGQKIEYALLPQAHTDGDIYVRFPADDVVVAGDVVSTTRYPVIDTASNGWSGGMVTGLRTLQELGKDETRYVQGIGPVVRRADLRRQEDMVATVTQRIGESYYKGETWEQLLASNPTREFDAAFGDPALFLRQSYEAAWYHVTEIRRVQPRKGA